LAEKEVTMKRKIGVIIDSFKLGVKPGIKKAAELGADGFQVYCTRGEMAPESMNKEARKDFKKFVADQGLVISALCGDLGKGLLNPEANKTSVPRSKEFIDLAVDLGTKVVTTHIGHLSEDENTPEWKTGVKAVQELSDYAESKGCFFASETGPESPVCLKKFLDKITSKGIKVNFDPANFVMCGPFDQIGGVSVLKDYIVHTHAKDGVCLMKGEAGKGNKYLEVPLGEGGVAWKYYLKALDDIGYKGFLTIEREVGADPAADIAKAIKFLRAFE
jgi:L-ribulose-5-phosphate 3-epimerase